MIIIIMMMVIMMMIIIIIMIIIIVIIIIIIIIIMITTKVKIIVEFYVESLILCLICKIDAWQISGRSLKTKYIFSKLLVIEAALFLCMSLTL